jgi:hypothetical protein
MGNCNQKTNTQKQKKLIVYDTRDEPEPFKFKIEKIIPDKITRPDKYPIEDFLSVTDKLKNVNMPGKPRVSMPPVTTILK